MADNPTFEIGLVMAGAISAGAYTAGVIDFLVEALDAYEEAKRDPNWDGPTHDVKVPVLAGASAGGMTAAIAALHFFHDLEHVRPNKAVPDPKNNRLYSSWVKDISIERLLETSDLATQRGVKPSVHSALCCTVLDEIVDHAFGMSDVLKKRNWVGRGANRTIDVILTLSNLRGMPYSFQLFGARSADRYGMLSHGDDLEFRVGLPGSPAVGKRMLDITDTSTADWSLFKTAALATGAFPIGLAPRVLNRPIADYSKSKRVGYEDKDGVFKTIDPDLPKGTNANYEFLCVDGGIIDNEPFELARRILTGDPNKRNPRDGNKADRALILVDPFPNYQDLPQASSDSRMLAVISSLLPALINQARFKPQELALAASDRVFSRFMIAPARNSPGAGKYPIACGTLGGFGGFLHESFRRHDYLLGQRNAQAFLRWNFALPESNPLFKKFSKKDARQRWYVRDPGERGTIHPEGDQKRPIKLLDTKVAAKGRKKEKALPIIPLTLKLREPIDIGATNLPAPDLLNPVALRLKVEERADAVLKVLIDTDLAKFIHEPLVGYAARKWISHVVTNLAMHGIEQARRDVAEAFGVMVTPFAYDPPPDSLP